MLDALLAEGCTVMVPTFTEGFEIAPPPGHDYERNDWNPDIFDTTGTIERIYDPGLSDVGGAMGVIPAALVRRPERVRGDHPLDSFSAIGPLASDLIADQTPLDVYAPFRSLIDLGGSVVQMGVGHTSLTLLHLAEYEAGRTLFRRWARGHDDMIIECAIGSCSNGFDAFEPVLAHLEAEIGVGDSRWRAFDAAEVVAAAAEAIRANPELTRCPDPECQRCEAAVAGGPVVRT